LAENQEGIVNWLSRQKYIVSLGWHFDLKPDYFRHEVRKLANDKNKRQDMADQGQLLFDGQGANRVARQIIMAAEKGDKQ